VLLSVISRIVLIKIVRDDLSLKSQIGGCEICTPPKQSNPHNIFLGLKRSAVIELTGILVRHVRPDGKMPVKFALVVNLILRATSNSPAAHVYFDW
jgi:hypothetical protein